MIQRIVQAGQGFRRDIEYDKSCISMTHIFASWLTDAKRFHERLAILPFEAAFGFWSIWVGVGAFFDETIASRLFNDALPVFTASVSNLAYVVSGLAILAGIGWTYRNIEAAGLIVLLTVLIIRSAVTLIGSGYSPYTASALSQAIIFGICIVVRLRTLFNNWSVVLLREPEVVTIETNDG